MIQQVCVIQHNIQHSRARLGNMDTHNALLQSILSIKGMHVLRIPEEQQNIDKKNSCECEYGTTRESER